MELVCIIDGRFSMRCDSEVAVRRMQITEIDLDKDGRVCGLILMIGIKLRQNTTSSDGI
jgi:hypothetical protein